MARRAALDAVARVLSVATFVSADEHVLGTSFHEHAVLDPRDRAGSLLVRHHATVESAREVWGSARRYCILQAGASQQGVARRIELRGLEFTRATLGGPAH